MILHYKLISLFCRFDYVINAIRYVIIIVVALITFSTTPRFQSHGTCNLKHKIIWLKQLLVFFRKLDPMAQVFRKLLKV